MPIFVHILFWSLGILILVAALIVVIVLWAGAISDGFRDEIRGSSREPDTANSHDRGSFWYRNAGWLQWAITSVSTVVWVNLLALFVQVAVWFYAGA